MLKYLDKLINDQKLHEDLMIDKKDIAFAYSSHLENLGMDNSDVDVYIISNKQKKIKFDRMYKNTGIKSYNYNSVKLDVEYITRRDFDLLISKIEKSLLGEIHMEQLKLLQRYQVGICINNNHEYHLLKTYIKNTNLRRYIFDTYMTYSRSSYFDSIDLARNNYHLGALSSAQKALEFSAQAFNLTKSLKSLKSKWYYELFMQNKANPYLDRFKDLLINKDNLSIEALGNEYRTLTQEMNSSNELNYLEEQCDI